MTPTLPHPQDRKTQIRKAKHSGNGRASCTWVVFILSFFKMSSLSLPNPLLVFLLASSLDSKEMHLAAQGPATAFSRF